MYNYFNWDTVVEWGKRAFIALIVIVIYQLTGIDLRDQLPVEDNQVHQFAEAEPDRVCEYVVKVEGVALLTQELTVAAPDGLPGGYKVIDIDIYNVDRTVTLIIEPGDNLAEKAKRGNLVTSRITKRFHFRQMGRRTQANDPEPAVPQVPGRPRRRTGYAAT